MTVRLEQICYYGPGTGIAAFLIGFLSNLWLGYSGIVALFSLLSARF